MERVRVLLVEDDEDDYILTRDLLYEIDGQRFELEWLSSYEEAIARVGRNDFDVALFDFRLGARTGLELLRAARERRCTAPVILMTGQGDLEVDLQAMQSGAADYLVKGEIDAALLERSIRYAIQQQRMEEERIRLAREQEARSQAEAANRAKDEFLALVSHELRTPLQAVIGWVALLEQGSLDAAQQARAVEVIGRNARAQAQIIDDLLDISRIVNGTLRLSLQPVELAPILEKTVEALHPASEAKSIDLQVRIEETPAQVSGDAGRLQQIFSNLLSNAIKFTPEGGRVEVELARVGDRACVVVRDTGRGISADFLPRVFERFHQAEGTGGDRKGGLGLGLAIARYLVEAHGGTIRAESPGEGQGATFTIEIPTLS
jgi:signal transduction histidine kinase